MQNTIKSQIQRLQWVKTLSILNKEHVKNLQKFWVHKNLGTQGT